MTKRSAASVEARYLRMAGRKFGAKGAASRLRRVNAARTDAQSLTMAALQHRARADAAAYRALYSGRVKSVAAGHHRGNTASAIVPVTVSGLRAERAVKRAVGLSNGYTRKAARRLGMTPRPRKPKPRILRG